MSFRQRLDSGTPGTPRRSQWSSVMRKASNVMRLTHSTDSAPLPAAGQFLSVLLVAPDSPATQPFISGITEPLTRIDGVRLEIVPFNQVRAPALCHCVYHRSVQFDYGSAEVLDRFCSADIVLIEASDKRLHPCIFSRVAIREALGRRDTVLFTMSEVGPLSGA